MLDNSILKIGGLYALSNEPCEGFEETEKIYRLVKVIDVFNDIALDCYVMKRVDDENSTIFSLTKEDCKLLGIDYEPRLQLLSKYLDWKLPRKERDKLIKEENEAYEILYKIKRGMIEAKKQAKEKFIHDREERYHNLNSEKLKRIFENCKNYSFE